MPIDYIPILAFLIFALMFAVVTIAMSSIIGKKKTTPEKIMPYECGVDPIGSARRRFPIKFVIIAMLFIIFDIEAVFLIPWAVVFKDLGVFGFIEMGVFIVILFIGLIYVWKKGALEWE
ncbi:MAG: NADH-quinone oxidoreductase subunit A [Thermodesulfobacteriota bacterium]|nr:NADH-quinone oxidoreductase subunit A [Thermodesulfobacteriota bacterium]